MCHKSTRSFHTTVTRLDVFWVVFRQSKDYVLARINVAQKRHVDKNAVPPLLVIVSCSTPGLGACDKKEDFGELRKALDAFLNSNIARFSDSQSFALRLVKHNNTTFHVWVRNVEPKYVCVEFTSKSENYVRMCEEYKLIWKSLITRIQCFSSIRLVLKYRSLFEKQLIFLDHFKSLNILENVFHLKAHREHKESNFKLCLKYQILSNITIVVLNTTSILFDVFKMHVFLTQNRIGYRKITTFTYKSVYLNW